MKTILATIGFLLLAGCVTKQTASYDLERVLPDALAISDNAILEAYAFTPLDQFERSYDIDGERLSVIYERNAVRVPTLDEPFTRFVTERFTVVLSETNVVSVTHQEFENNRIPPSRNNI